MRTKYESLKILINEISPACISLQETMLGLNKTLCPRDYVSYNSDNDEERDHHGGSALLFRCDVPHRKIVLQTNLQAVAVQMFSKRNYTICSLYLPPSNNLNHNLIQELNNLTEQLPHTLW